jgi:hypothetical protein
LINYRRIIWGDLESKQFNFDEVKASGQHEKHIVATRYLGDFSAFG